MIFLGRKFMEKADTTQLTYIDDRQVTIEELQMTHPNSRETIWLCFEKGLSTIDWYFI